MFAQSARYARWLSVAGLMLPLLATQAALATPIAQTAAIAATDAWPMAGHDPGQSNANAADPMTPAEAASLHLRWQFRDASPAMEAAGKLYVITQDSTGRLLALNSATGSLIQPFFSTQVRSVAYVAPYLYINRGAWQQPSEIRIVDAATDAWLHTATYTGGPAAAFFSSFIVAGGRIYTGVFFQNGAYLPRYFAFDATDGRLLWSRPGNGMVTAPSLVGGVLYVTEEGYASLEGYEIDPLRGAMVKSFPTQLGDWHSAGVRLYAMAITKVDWSPRLTVSTRFLAYDLSGRVVWTAPNEEFGTALPDRVFTLAPRWSMGNWVTARRAADGRLLWQIALPPSWYPVLGQIVATSRLLFVQASNGAIAVLDASSGRLLRILKPPFKSMEAADLLVADGMVYESVVPSVPAANGTFAPERPVTLAFGL